MGTSSSPASRLYADRSLRIDDLASNDPATTECLAVARMAAPHDLEVLIVGESGTGKNLLALAIHNEGKRRGMPFVPLNTAAVPEELIESELFGHEKGAFTGALAERRGIFQEADGGTLFLDEIGNMGSLMQQKLLNVVEHRRFRRVGSSQEVGADFRLISATNAHLTEDIKSGAFRRDLYYRLGRVVIRLPPLRERCADILPFARRFLAEANERMGKELHTFAPDCEGKILAYEWPGNVRQLYSSILGAVARSSGSVLEWPAIACNLEPRPAEPAGNAPTNGELPPPVSTPLELVERWHIERVLRSVAGNITQAAGILGISRRGLYDMMRRHNL